MSIPIQGIYLVRAVREIAAERPDVSYPERTCYYIRGRCSDETVGCLVGQALRRLGIGEHLLQKIDATVKDDEGNTKDSCASAVLAHDLSDVVGTSEIQRAWLDVVQNHQDSGFTWKQAVLQADTEIGL